VLGLLEEWQHNEAALGGLLEQLGAERFRRESVPLASLRVHAPVAPRQIFCSGANYRKHVIDLIVDQAREAAVAEMSRAERFAYAEKLMDDRAAHGTPYIFSRVTSSICGPFDDVELPHDVEQPDWELELAAVIGRPAFRVPRAQAHHFIAGYTICNDLTNRELVHRQDLKALGSDWVMGKNLPGYMPMGPFLVPASFVPAPQDVRITLKLNGQVMQDESTTDMIFDIARLLEYLTSRVRLYPGDLLLTGSPSGNGSHYQRFLRAGDVMEGTIEGLGEQRNICVSGR
jgi:2-keto-4-pentenoate hydratase/2-oxohepta-3-ene-1,7-dioic acid hydratase in catechol pathway